MSHDADPDNKHLAGLVGRALGLDARDAGLRVVSRFRSPYASSFPSEVVILEDSGATRVKVLCKYAAHLPSDPGHGDRQGLAYEGSVYRDILEPVGMSTPRLLGWHPAPGVSFLALEFVEGGLQLSQASSESVVSAARWAARFHSKTQSVAARSPSWLVVHDFDYYAGWVHRTQEFTQRWSRSHPWISDACAHFAAIVDELVAEPSVIHGEFYPNNILVSNDEIVPVDWETAAVAAGEIDLAALTDGWPSELVARCETAYREVREKEGISSRFSRRLEAARVYLHFRWLGYRREWTEHPAAAARLQELHSSAQSFGLI